SCQYGSTLVCTLLVRKRYPMHVMSFFVTDTATTEIYTLSLHDALPIWRFLNEWEAFKKVISRRNIRRRITIPLTLSNLMRLRIRSEERFSRNAETDLVCRLLLEKKKQTFAFPACSGWQP